MLQTVLIIVALAIVNIKSKTISSGCTVNINDGLGYPQPLYFHHNSSRFIQTTPNLNAFELKRNQTFTLHCSTGFRSRSDNNTARIHQHASCVSGNEFVVDNKTVFIKDFACLNHPKHIAKFMNESCSVGDLVEIGFTVEKSVPLMRICHDQWDASTKWTHHRLNPSSALHQRQVPRPSFRQAQFYKGIDPNKLYKRTVQLQTLKTLLKSEELARELIRDENSFFLSRGHLAAKSDFVFASHQLTTFYYINAAPQWLSFNSGNWLQVETSLKKFVAQRNIDVDVYTGTNGVASYADINGVYQPFYLSSNDPKRQRIPVPKIFYKVVVDQDTNHGIVLIGVNDPHASNDRIKSEYIICPDISHRIDYIAWNRKNITAGYSYACAVNEFVKVVKHLPDLSHVTELLL